MSGSDDWGLVVGRTLMWGAMLGAISGAVVGVVAVLSSVGDDGQGVVQPSWLIVAMPYGAVLGGFYGAVVGLLVIVLIRPLPPRIGRVAGAVLAGTVSAALAGPLLGPTGGLYALAEGGAAAALSVGAAWFAIPRALGNRPVGAERLIQ